MRQVLYIISVIISFVIVLTTVSRITFANDGFLHTISTSNVEGLSIHYSNSMLFQFEPIVINNQLWDIVYEPDDKEKVDDKIDGTYAVVVKNFDNEIQRRFDLDSNNITASSEKIARYTFNEPEEVLLEVAPSSRYFLLKPFADFSYLFDVETGQQINFFENINDYERGEVMLGFDRDGNIFCGVQDINPMVVLRDFKTREIVRQYAIRPMAYLDSRNEYQNWIADKDANELGIIYNYLRGPLESHDGKYVVFTFTVFQFKCLYAVAVVCDNKSGDVISKMMIDTSDANTFEHIFNYSKDGKFLLFRDGRNKICVIDLEKKRVVSDFTTPVQAVSDESISVTKIIQSYFFLSNDKVIIQMKMPIAGYMSSGIEGPPEKPLTMSYLWDTNTGEITESPYSLDGTYTLRYWLSPDGKTIATYYVKYAPNDFTITNRKLCEEGIAFWDTASGKLLHSIDGHIESFMFMPDWKTMTIISFKDFPSDEQQTTQGTKTVYDISKLTNRDTPSLNENFRKWTTSNNKFSTEAVFVRVQDNSVVLKKRDDKEVTVPIEKLSDTDREYIREQTKEQLAPKTDKPKN